MISQQTVLLKYHLFFMKTKQEGISLMSLSKITFNNSKY